MPVLNRKQRRAARAQMRTGNLPEPERDVITVGVWLYHVRALTVNELAYIRVVCEVDHSPFMVCASLVAFGLERVERAPMTGEGKASELPRETVTFPNGEQHEVVGFAWIKRMTPGLLNKLACRIEELTGLSSKQGGSNGR